MRQPETITMTMRELDRLKVIQAVVDHGLAVWRAAEKLGLSRRQVERLVLRSRAAGHQCPARQTAGLAASGGRPWRGLRTQPSARTFQLCRRAFNRPTLGHNSVVSGQHHRPTGTPQKTPTPHKKHARTDI